jgi:hypothetical protein
MTLIENIHHQSARGSLTREFFVFLSGPLTGLSYDESIAWRRYVSGKLPPFMRAYSALRGKEYLAEEDVLLDAYEDYPLSSRKGITCRDRMDVIRCDLLFVNLLGTTRVSIGTVMEIAWADILRKPIVVVMEEDNIHAHGMIKEVASYIVPDLDEGIRIATAVCAIEVPEARAGMNFLDVVAAE